MRIAAGWGRRVRAPMARSLPGRSRRDSAAPRGTLHEVGLTQLLSHHSLELVPLALQCPSIALLAIDVTVALSDLVLDLLLLATRIWQSLYFPLLTFEDPDLLLEVFNLAMGPLYHIFNILQLTLQIRIGRHAVLCSSSTDGV